MYMKLVGVEIIEKAQKHHAHAAKRLSAWKAEVTSKTIVWASFQDVHDRYPKTDKVGDRYVFDIGDQFRLIAKIHFAAGVVVIRWFGTHAEYDKMNVREI